MDTSAALNKNFLAVSETVNNELGIIKKTTKDLTIFATNTTNRINTLVEQIKENANQNVKMIQFVSDNEEIMRSFGNNLTLFTAKLNHLILETQNHYTNLLAGIQMLVGGILLHI